MKYSFAALLLAVTLCAVSVSPVRADDALVLKPGLTERGAKPTTWTVDVSADPKGAMAGVSSRLYGAFEAALSKPLVFKTNFAAARVFAFKIGAVSKVGAELKVSLNDQTVEPVKWSAGQSAQAAGALYAVNLPAGANTISLEVADRNGVVVMDSYTFADSLDEMKDAKPLNGAAPAGQTKTPAKPETNAPKPPATDAKPATAGALWTLKPGVTERGKTPGSWTLDVSDLDEAGAKSAAAKLSSRLYGAQDGALHQPLVVKTDAQTPRVVGFAIGAVSKAGVDLTVKLDGKEVWQKTWAAAAATHDSDKVLTLTLPAGAHEISFETGKGVVVWNAIYIGGDAAQMPGTPERIEFAAAPPGAAKPTATNDDAPTGGAVVTSTPNTRMNGYFPIWFALGQPSQYGDKYSGGLGTYTANHVPMAVYSAAADKTFFTYGGTRPGEKHLLNMVGYFDHKTGMVSRPVMVYDKKGVDDPHDNGTLNIDGDGTVWLFISGRGKKRPGFKYRSVKPYDISAWQQVSEEEMTYPQPWHDKDKGWLHLFTKYTAGRELYFESSADGKTWSADQKLAGFGGHYQVSGLHKGKIGTFFNYHPGGDVDKRTNLYYAQTTDWGKTWTTVDGKPLELPLNKVANPALVIDQSATRELMYTDDLNWDKNGHPVLLYVVSKDGKPGPSGGDRKLVVTHWTGTAWETHDVAGVDHNYDDGSLWVNGDEWKVIAPTAIGPQKWQGGGEMELWASNDAGKTWAKTREITTESARNHNYARRPQGAKDPFFAYWADGDPTKFGESRLFFCDSSGQKVFQLPTQIEGEVAAPIEVVRPKP